MDQSQNNSNSSSPATPTVTPEPIDSGSPVSPSTPPTPVVSPSVEPAEIPTTPSTGSDSSGSVPPSVYDTGSGSSMQRIIFLFIGLLLVMGALYGGYWYMNQQTNSTYQQPTPTIIPTEVPATVIPTTATSGASLQEEKDLHNVNLGSDEAQITDIQKDLNGL